MGIDNTWDKISGLTMIVDGSSGCHPTKMAGGNNYCSRPNYTTNECSLVPPDQTTLFRTSVSINSIQCISFHVTILKK